MPIFIVHETVEQAKRDGFGAQASFLNAVLRGYLREADETRRLFAELKTSQPALGYSHPVSIEPPAGIEFEVPQPTEVVVRGIDKQLVGQVAADIRKRRPPEPYKGKGIRYRDEHVMRKVGKRA